ncbi:unnamed protein product [Lactuca saligna]|uniref:F-box/LRR-repeat protein 15/At3g58940/PEG3-like LRR domain-containing protein n=1 Tax=Lactuca saligna TaxID=75948 RepID=A0AA35ZIF9_LACSI|nr:unnamed protein product [Lactuca saligna]
MEIVEEVQNQPTISKKRMKFKEIVEERGEDRVSSLQDCLLLEILSRLPYTKDAIGTGTLSKRWKHLWIWVPSLIFSDHNLPSWKFFSFVNKTLTQCRQLKLKKFEVSIFYDIHSGSQLNNWIHYAIRRNVEELNLMIRNVDVRDKFLLDQCFFNSSCFTDLTLEGCMLNPCGAISWKNLRSLWICEVHLNEDLIENIIAGSPVLETLMFVKS